MKITLKRVTFTYQGRSEPSLIDTSLSIKTGQCVVLTGASGSGKTTITRLINGLIPKFYAGDLQGEIKFDGQDLTTLSAEQISQHIGSVFQNPRSQFFNVDTTSELVFSSENKGIPPETIHQRLMSVVKNLNIQDLLNRNIFALSGGQKQMLAIATVYMQDPDVYVFDEPSANLDMAAIAKLRQVIKHLKSQGKTIIIAEHRLYYLRDLADKVYSLDNTRIRKSWSGIDFFKLTNSQRCKEGLRALDLETLNPPIVSIDSSLSQGIELKDFEMTRHHKQIIKNVTTKVPAGTITAIVGPNGAGKSTLANGIVGAWAAKGVVSWHNTIYSRKKRRGQWSLVMQSPSYELFTDEVRHELEVNSKISSSKTDAILSQLQLTIVAQEHPLSLSGGQQQRVVIATAYSQQAPIIILDEPTSGLDYINMLAVSKLLTTLANSGCVVLVITHDYEFLLSACQRVIHLEKGKITDNIPVTKQQKYKILTWLKNK